MPVMSSFKSRQSGMASMGISSRPHRSASINSAKVGAVGRDFSEKRKEISSQCVRLLCIESYSACDVLWLMHLLRFPECTSMCAVPVRKLGATSPGFEMGRSESLIRATIMPSTVYELLDDA